MDMYFLSFEKIKTFIILLLSLLLMYLNYCAFEDELSPKS